MAERKAAVIGVRNVGFGHAKAWHGAPGARLVAVADLEAPLRQKAADELGVDETYADYRDLLADSDAEIVSVCVPTGMHERVVSEVLRSGRDVLCEKPPATEVDEAVRMHQVAQAEGRTLGYSLQRRFEGGVRAARGAVEDGRTGPLFYGRAGWVRTRIGAGPSTPWRIDRERGGGSLLDIGIHLFDVAWFTMGCPRPVSAYGFTTSRHADAFAKIWGCDPPESPADITSAAIVRFENGETLVLESSFGMHRAPGQEVYCDLAGDDAGLRIYPGPTALVTNGDMEDIEPEAALEPREGIVRDFLRAVNEGAAPCVDSLQGVWLMQVMDAIVRSGEEGREIPITER